MEIGTGRTGNAASSARQGRGWFHLRARKGVPTVLAKLLPDLDQVAAADDANGDFLRAAAEERRTDAVRGGRPEARDRGVTSQATRT